MYHRRRLVACPSVFAKTKWVQRMLTPYELLRAFDVPITMDNVLLPKCSSTTLPFGIEESLSPLVISSIFGFLWGVTGGVQGVQAQCPTATADAIGPQEDLVEKSNEVHEGTPVVGRVDVETSDAFESASTPAAMSVSSDDSLEEVSEVWDLGSDSDSEDNCSSERGCGNPLLTKETQSGATLHNSPSDERSQDRIKIM